MPTIATTVYPDEAYVLVEVDWTDVPAVEYARVVRTNTVTGEQVTLRPYGAYNTAGDLLLTCGIGLWWDTEPPIGQAVTYRTEAADILVNTVVNGGFEAGVAPWTVTGGTLAQSAVFAKVGAFSGLVTPNGTSVLSQITQPATPILPGVPAVLSGWVLSPQGWNSVRLQARWLNTGGIQTGATLETPVEIIDDAEWRWMTITGTPPADAVTVAITAQVSGTAPGTTLFYWDQLSVAQLAAVPNVATSGLVTVTATFPYYLKDPVFPCHDQAMTRCIPNPRLACNTDPGIMVKTYGPRETYTPNTILLEAVTDPAPIPVIRERSTPESALILITRTFPDRDAVKELLRPGTVLFFQAPPEYGIDDRYIAVGVETIEAPVEDRRVQPRYITLPHVVTKRPLDAANGVCGARIDDLCDIYASWNAISLAGLTYTDLLLGLASTSGPGAPPVSGMRTFDVVKAEFADFNDVDNGVRTFTGLLNGL